IFERLQFNTAIAGIMELCNEISDYLAIEGAAHTPALREALESAVLLLTPMAPHLCEELWHTLGHSDYVVSHLWPIFDEAIARDDLVTIVVQVNGKKRGEIIAAPNAEEGVVKELALRDPNVAQHTEGKSIKKVIFVKGRLLNLVVAP